MRFTVYNKVEDGYLNISCTVGGNYKFNGWGRYIHPNETVSPTLHQYENFEILKTWVRSGNEFIPKTSNVYIDIMISILDQLVECDNNELVIVEVDDDYIPLWENSINISDHI